MCRRECKRATVAVSPLCSLVLLVLLALAWRGLPCRPSMPSEQRAESRPSPPRINATPGTSSRFDSFIPPKTPGTNLTSTSLHTPAILSLASKNFTPHGFSCGRLPPDAHRRKKIETSHGNLPPLFNSSLPPLPSPPLPPPSSKENSFSRARRYSLVQGREEERRGGEQSCCL